MPYSQLLDSIENYISREHLPASYLDGVTRLLIPFTKTLLPKILKHEGCFFLGISGSQGSGKSTLAEILRLLFEPLLQNAKAGLVVTLSLDDFYLSRVERQYLAKQVHPLLVTRGVPGTHDVELALKTLTKLGELSPECRLALPRFNKATDDLEPEDLWPEVKGPIKLIILEGWCLSVEPQNKEGLLLPVNKLEKESDSDGGWRGYVNECLSCDYQTLFNKVNHLIYLSIPSFDYVYQWRNKQERMLQKTKPNNAESRLMSEVEISRFVQHFERITRHAMETLPLKADTLITIDKDHQLLELK